MNETIIVMIGLFGGLLLGIPLGIGILEAWNKFMEKKGEE